MIPICRIFCAVLALMAALGVAQAQEARVTLAMTPAPLGGAMIAPLERAALVCGNSFASSDYVTGPNCKNACKKLGHPAFLCQTTLVPLCQACWKNLVQCDASWNGDPVIAGPHCALCSYHYANCMKSFLK